MERNLDDPIRPIAAPLITKQRAGGRYLALARAMRPRQFIKNGVVFLALVFTVGLDWQPNRPGSWLPLLARTMLAFIAFCGVAAGEYLNNDAADVENDRHHPLKRLRPIAAGDLSAGVARRAAAVLLALGLVLGLPLGWRFTLVLASYALLVLGYTYLLKRVAVLDVLTIAVGFVLRAMAGAFAIRVPVSPWLYLCTILGALLLAINKRRHELLLLDAGAPQSRASLAQYTPALLDRMSAAVTAATVIAYSLYTLTAATVPANHVMVATVPFVVYGVLRYRHLVYRRNKGGSPDELIVQDRPLFVCLLLWLTTAGILLSVFR